MANAILLTEKDNEFDVRYYLVPEDVGRTLRGMECEASWDVREEGQTYPGLGNVFHSALEANTFAAANGIAIVGEVEQSFY